jgi:regulator of replication initiation timing
MNTNNLFNTNFSTSNPFNMSAMNNPTQDLENSLMQSYAKLEALKAKQNQLQQPAVVNTVFSDIAKEFEGLSSDEMNFIIASDEYQKLNGRYQDEFTQFLIGKFANEYLQTGNAKTLEEMLFTIRQKKDQYKQKFTEDINQIKDQNKNLVEKNNLLAENNQALQEQLKKLLKDR